MEIKKNNILFTAGTLCVLLTTSAFSAYDKLDAIIKLYKNTKDTKTYDFKVEITGANNRGNALFKKRAWLGGGELTIQDGRHKNLTRIFIPDDQDRFFFDSTQIDSVYLPAIDAITEVNGPRIRFLSRAETAKGLENEKKKLKRAILNLSNGLRNNIFDYILNDINQFPAGGGTQEAAANEMCKLIEKGLGGNSTATSSVQLDTDIDRMKAIYQHAEAFCKNYTTKKEPPVMSMSPQIDLYGENPINQSARTIYRLVQNFCATLGVETPAMYSWISISGIKTGLLYGGSAAAVLGLSYYVIQNPEALSTLLEKGQSTISNIKIPSLPKFQFSPAPAPFLPAEI